MKLFILLFSVFSLWLLLPSPVFAQYECGGEFLGCAGACCGGFCCQTSCNSQGTCDQFGQPGTTCSCNYGAGSGSGPATCTCCAGET